MCSECIQSAFNALKLDNLGGKDVRKPKSNYCFFYEELYRTEEAHWNEFEDNSEKLLTGDLEIM